MTDKKTAESCAEKLQAIAEPNRIRIIECLRTKSMNVTELAKALNVEIVNVSLPVNEGVVLQRPSAGDFPGDRFVFHSPDLRIALPSAKRLPVEDRFPEGWVTKK